MNSCARGQCNMHGRRLTVSKHFRPTCTVLSAKIEQCYKGYHIGNMGTMTATKLFIFCNLLGLAFSSHFRGAVIQWSPVNNNGAVSKSVTPRPAYSIYCLGTYAVRVYVRRRSQRSMYDGKTVNGVAHYAMHYAVSV